MIRCLEITVIEKNDFNKYKLIKNDFNKYKLIKDTKILIKHELKLINNPLINKN